MDVAAGDLLVVATSTYAARTINAPIDTQGNTWTLATTATRANGALAAIHYAFAKSSGPNKVTCRLSDADNLHCHVYEVANIASAAPIIVTSGSSTPEPGTAQIVSTSSTVGIGDYVFAFFATNNTNTIAADPAYRNPEISDTGGDNALSEDNVATSPTIQTATATTSAGAFTNLIVAFRRSP
jgi:hypothetical protein